MQVPIKKSTGDGEKRPVLEDGSYPAVLVAIVDLGTHSEKSFDNANEEDVHKVYLVWELPGEVVAGTTNVTHCIGKDFRLSLHEKANLRNYVARMLPPDKKACLDGDTFEMDQMLGTACLVSLSKHENSKGNEYNKVTGVSPLVRGMPAPTPTREPFSWWIANNEPMFDAHWLPYLYGQKVTEKILASHEFRVTGTKPAAHANGNGNGAKPAATSPPPAQSRPATPPPARRPTPPPPAGKAMTPPPERQFYVWDGTEEKRMGETAVRSLLTKDGIPAEQLHVKLKEEDEWSTAHAFQLDIPW